MAYVLSLRPQSPLKRSFSDSPYLNSCSPQKDTLLAPLSDITARNGSACSLYTLGATRADWSRSNENTPPLTSQSLLDLVPEKPGFPFSTRHVVEEPRKRNCGPDRPPPSFSRLTALSKPLPRGYHKSQQAAESSSDDEDSADDMDVDDNNFDETHLFNLYEAIHVPLPEGRFTDDDGNEPREDYEEPVTITISSQPFRRWMSTLRRRHAQRWRENFPDTPRLSFDTADGLSALSRPLERHSESARRTSESMTSSMDYVTAIKSASMTTGTKSLAPRSEAGRVRLGNRSSNYSDARRSLESHRGALGPVLDENAWLRSLQRRKVVEELISSEESYIADLKVLINDYFMILTALPTLSSQTRSSIQHNISQILQLHEDLLAELHEVVPQADLTRSAYQETYPVTKAKHIRFHSADIVPGRLAEHLTTRRLRHSLEIGRSPDRRPKGLVTDTKTAGNIAKIFNKHMRRFFTYEEYGAHWTTMSQDLTTMCKGLHGWQEYERGVEALQKVVASENNREAGCKKALSFPDLLIKPIQRVCKYPLLFDDLCRHTPVYDDPEAHAELEKALFRLQETIREVNKAKDDPQTRRLIEITWQLQDRLAFSDQKISRALVFRLLGHVLLCGALHVTYQMPDRIKGSYMVCVLYKSCLVLATASRFHTPYTVVASIGLANASIEESDNGRGIQCHTAPHTWKFVFEHGHRLHELIFSACSSQEEEVWKKQLRERIVYETHDFVEGQSTMQDMYTSLSLGLKSLGPVFGHANTLVRRMSVHRAATLGAKPNMSQVIIKNTQAQRLPDTPPTFSPSIVTRSQSHLSSNHIPILAPRRAERVRLEGALEDVWTKDMLPFPGMSNRRMENQIRASANSVMRKLSMASIASNFSRRSPSLSNTSHTRSEDSGGSRVHKMSNGNLRAQSVATDRRPGGGGGGGGVFAAPQPPVVDFHSAPAAFLPEDFEVRDARSGSCSRRRRLAHRAIGVERPAVAATTTTANDKMVVMGKPKKVRRLSTHLISLPRSESSARMMGERKASKESSAATTMRGGAVAVPPDNRVDGAKKEGESRRQTVKKKRRDECSGHDATGEARPASAGVASVASNKFAKSKSRIFNFFR